MSDLGDLRARITNLEDWQSNFGINPSPHAFPQIIGGMEGRIAAIEDMANAVVHQALVPELAAVREAMNATRSALDLQLIPELDVVVGRVDTLEQQYNQLLTQLNAFPAQI